MPTPYAAGRHFLQIPGPTNVPDRVLRAMDYPTIDHRGPQFAEIGAKCLAGMKTIFKTDSHAVIYPASGTGAWESALVNTLQEGDLVLMVETGHFASLWHKMASRLGLETEFLATDWRRGVDPQQVEDRLRADTENKIKAVCIVHNETSTGSTSRVNEVRAAMNNAGHDALLLADTISSLGSIDFRHDEWGVDVTVAGSQKGLMLPPGLSFNAVSEKALAVASKGGMRRSYWDWEEQIAANKDGAVPVAVKCKPGAGRPEVANGPEHRLSVQLVEAVLRINKKNRVGVLQLIDVLFLGKKVVFLPEGVVRERGFH